MLRGCQGLRGGCQERAVSRHRHPNQPSPGQKKDGRTGDEGSRGWEQICGSPWFSWADRGLSLSRYRCGALLPTPSWRPKETLVPQHAGWRLRVYGGEGQPLLSSSQLLTGSQGQARAQHRPTVMLLSLGDLSHRIRFLLTSARQYTHTHTHTHTYTHTHLLASLVCT